MAGNAAGSSFMLVGGQASELQRYMNSRVEVRGTIDSSASHNMGTMGSTGASNSGTYGAGNTAGSTANTSPTGSTAGSTATTPSSSNPSSNPSSAAGSTGSTTGSTASSDSMDSGSSMAGGQTLHVTSVRQVAGSCSGSNR